MRLLEHLRFVPPRGTKYLRQEERKIDAAQINWHTSGCVECEDTSGRFHPFWDTFAAREDIAYKTALLKTASTRDASQRCSRSSSYRQRRQARN